MRLVRGIVRLAGWLGWAALLAPVLALPTAAVIDAGPSGLPRFTLFPLALAALDPHVWDSVRNSLIMSAAVTFASYFLGLGVAWAVVRRRFWGIRTLALLGCAGLALPPGFAAIGLRGLFPHLVGGSLAPPEWLSWLAWFWAALGFGAPLVGLAAYESLGRLDPAWEDAACWAGAGRRATWRHLLAPVVRPDLAGALGVVFSITLVEPGAPMVLGLRRTLAFQVVRSALSVPSPGELTRAAVLATIGVALAWVGRRLLRWWGGPVVETPNRISAELRVPRAGWQRGLLCFGLLGLIALLAWTPWASLALAGGFSRTPPAALWRHPLMQSTLITAGLLGLVVTLIDLVLALIVVRFATNGRVRFLSVLDGLPPLAIGVGALALPALLDMAVASVNGGSLAPTGRWLRELADLLDLDRSPGVVLVLATAAVRFPWLVRATLEARERLRPAVVDAAVTLGVRPSKARRILAVGRFGAPAGALWLTFALASTSVTPALILSPTADTRPIGPTVLRWADAPSDGLARAAILGGFAATLNLSALAFASRRGGRVSLTRSWLPR